MARTITATQKTAQQGVSRTPYVRVVINGVDYSSKVRLGEHHEEAYRDRAVILLTNDDRALDAVEFRGHEFKIGYGDTTGVTEDTWAASTAYSVDDVVIPSTPNTYRYRCKVAGTSDSSEPSPWSTTPNGTNVDNTVTWEMHGSSGDECSESATLWVKNQQFVSSQGVSVCQLYCEGCWSYMREQRMMLVTTKGAATPYYDVQYSADTTIYDIIEDIIENNEALNWTLNALGGGDDTIIDDHTPEFDINENPYESAAALIYRLLWMTKTFLRCKADKIFEIVFPQAGDSANQTYKSNATPGTEHAFLEYTEKVNYNIPNHVVVFANRDAAGTWDNIVTAHAYDATQFSSPPTYDGNYVEVLEPFVAPTVPDQADADDRAAAILSKIQQEALAGRAIIPHDATVELYDKVAINDNRGDTLTYPTSAVTRVTNLVHRFSPGNYTLEIALGEVETAFGLPVPNAEAFAAVPEPIPPIFIPPPGTPPPQAPMPGKGGWRVGFAPLEETSAWFRPSYPGQGAGYPGEVPPGGGIGPGLPGPAPPTSLWATYPPDIQFYAQYFTQEVEQYREFMLAEQRKGPGLWSDRPLDVRRSAMFFTRQITEMLYPGYTERMRRGAASRTVARGISETAPGRRRTGSTDPWAPGGGWRYT